MSAQKRKDSIATSSPAKRQKGSHDEHSEFRVVSADLVLSVPPVFAANPRAGVQEMLDSMVMRYNPSLQGVVLSHSNLKFVKNFANIQGDCPFLICTIAFDATLWSPQIGFNLSGRINLCSPDHISLLVHKTFNVSIPRHHIPNETWEFEYGPAENIPEFGQAEQQETTNEDEKSRLADNHTGGRWVHQVTGEVLGGDTQLLQFTVIGLTVANEMLSLLGSLQADPFSTRHVVDRKAEKQKESNSDSDEESDAGLGLESSDDDEEGDYDSGEDTLQQLGKRRDAEVKEFQSKKRKENGSYVVAV